jgi:hypothetical protein
MPQSEVSITSASGETEYVATGDEGVAFVGLTGTMSAGGVVILVKPNGASTGFVSDVIDVTTLQQVANEAGTGYSFFEPISVPGKASVKLAANASFSGSLTAIVVAEPY